MYNLNDTIIAVSSGATTSLKKIVRISGDKTFDILRVCTGQLLQRQRQIISISINIEEFEIECLVYFFVSPNSYTGEDIAEIHICGCDEVVENIFSKLLSAGCRSAHAGEFTYRAYVNGKIDLSRAEAIAAIIESSNEYQLAASQKLFGGSIESKVGQIRKDILELLSLIEAGLDFSSEDIEIISKAKASKSANNILNNLKELLSGSITFEQISQAPSVVVCGAANAGKSSLVNALLGENRSIVSEQSGTTRDVLEHWLKLEKCDCVLFDSAGIIPNPKDILQNLANQAALKAIDDATVLIFCADSAKKDYSEDLKILQQFKNKPDIYAASKCDLVNENNELKNLFGGEFLPVSAHKNINLEELKQTIDQRIISQTAKSTEAEGKTALTERHRQAVNSAAVNIENANAEIEKGNEEIAAYLLREALQNLSKLATEHIDEAILDNIFSKFCIGK